MFKNNNSNKHIPRPIKGLFFLAMLALFFFVLGNVIMYLWNEILAEATGVKTLNFWEAIGLFILIRILFGGFRFGPRHGGWQRSRKHWRGKWMNMSDEERAEFKSKWKKRCNK